MKISVNQGESGFENFLRYEYIIEGITINGRVSKLAVRADEEEGTATEMISGSYPPKYKDYNGAEIKIVWKKDCQPS
jgi:hypothetical protein